MVDKEDVIIDKLVEKTIKFNEDWVINMIMNEKESDLEFSRAIRKYEMNRKVRD